MNRVEAFWEGEDHVAFPRLIPLSVVVVAVASLLQWLVPIGILEDIEFVEDIAWFSYTDRDLVPHVDQLLFEVLRAAGELT